MARCRWNFDPSLTFTAYDANPQEFYVVCTDIESGQPVYHKYLGPK